MVDNKMMTEEELESVSGGESIEEVLKGIVNTLIEQALNYLRTHYVDPDEAINAVKEDASVLGPEIQALIAKVGESKVYQLIKSRWNV